MYLKQFSLIFLFPALILAFPQKSPLTPLEIRQGLFATQVLCKDALGNDLPNCDSCSKFPGRKCAPSNECLDIPDRDDGGDCVTIRTAQLGFNAGCPNDEDVCCEHPVIKNPNVDKNCADDPDFHCVGIQDCDGEIKVPEGKEVVKVTNKIDIRQGGFLDAPTLESLNDEIFASNPVTIQIDNKITTCKKDIEVCCKRTIPSAAPSPSPTQDVIDEVFAQCNPPAAPPAAPPSTSQRSVVPTTPAPPPKPLECGIHNAGGLEITASNPSNGRANTHAGEWPHSCLLFDTSRTSQGDFVGGATLIAPGVIITAAHKVDQISQSSLFVRCGDWDLTGTEEFSRHQDRKVRQKTIHPQYTGTSGTSEKVNYNFALLHLESDFDLALHINPICLPDIPNQKTGQFGDNCIATGWGKENYRDTNIQTLMKQIELPMVDNEKCQQQLRAAKNSQGTTILGQAFNLHESFNCAGGEENVDACEGDGGGPLVCPKLDDPSRFVLSGIVSWGLECGKKDVPGVYADVTQGLCFIDYATKCIHGKKYQQFYDYPQCTNWLVDLLATLESKFDGIGERQGSLKKASDLFKACEGFNPRQPSFN